MRGAQGFVFGTRGWGHTCRLWVIGWTGPAATRKRGTVKRRARYQDPDYKGRFHGWIPSELRDLIAPVYRSRQQGWWLYDV